MWRAGFKWMFLIIGTMIGAGYASGRELWQFFGNESGLAILLFMLLFIAGVYIIMYICYSYKTTSYLTVLEILIGKKTAKYYDVLIFFYLVSTTVVMIAGSGATFEAFLIPSWIGIIFIVCIMIIVFIRGIQGVITLNLWILPVLIIGLLSVLIMYSIDEDLSYIIDWDHQHNWYAAFTFTALNILSILAVLGAVGEKMKTKGEIWIASIGSGLILGIISYIYNNSLIQISEIIILYEIPLFAILKNYPAYTYIVMSILLWSAIFTTAVSGLLGIVTRLRTLITMELWKIATITLIVLLPLTQIGFSTLIAWIYPIYGIVNLVLLAAILLFPLSKKIIPKDTL
ncbi:Uncharacterized membrane protein YkvI [Gracilibacillus ureilyticus]|uniref:Uncharacterized membrane protein YkvI n=1 Tax=Gracilibacillus ureilyticus TaxID=531814 RepID=A0A1H9UYW7_9BACI|nr:hypothetical protein [Gracilibacillus ureilyticus]SES14685.1 Uncharacterized membrane protein YkvI [Gracilibacillus ureilyticus]